MSALELVSNRSAHKVCDSMLRIFQNVKNVCRNAVVVRLSNITIKILNHQTIYVFIYENVIVLGLQAAAKIEILDLLC